MSAERKGRTSLWGGERYSSMSRRASRSGKADKEKQRSDRKGKATKETKENSKGESQGEKDGAEKIKVEAESEGSKEEVQKGSADRPGPRKVEKDDIKAEVVGQVGMVGGGSPSVGEDKTSEVRTVDQQLKAETAGKTEDDIAGSIGDGKSFRSFNSRKSANQSQGSTKPGKRRWSLMIPGRSTQSPVPSNLTEDVAGPRFEAVKEPEWERCAGDYPSIYVDGFVSLIPSPYIYVL